MLPFPYAENNPVNNTDPSGHFVPLLAGGAAAVSGEAAAIAAVGTAAIGATVELGMEVWDMIRGNRVNWDPNTPIQDQLKGQGQLRDLRNNPNLDGVDINDLLRKTPNELNDMLKNGKINKKTYKQLKKAFEGRDLGKRGKK